MNPRTTFGLLAATLLVGGYIALVERRGDTTDERRARALRAFRIVPEKVQVLRIEAGALKVECVREGDRWRMTEPVRGAADAAAVDRILLGLEALPRGEVITARDRRGRSQTDEDFGLGLPRATFRLRGEGLALAFHVGRATPLGGLFLREEGRGDFVSTSTNLLALIPAGLDVLRDRSLLRGETARVRRLQIRRADGFLQVVRTDPGDWVVQQPFDARADREEIEKLLDALLRARIEEFVQDGVTEGAPYGFDETATEVTLEFDRADLPGVTLQLGRAPDQPAGRLYARLKGGDSVVTVAAALREPLGVRADALRERRLTPIDPAGIAAFTVLQGDRSVTVERRDAGWRISAPVVAEADTATVEATLREWATTRVERFVDPPITNLAAYGLEPPAGRVVFLRRDAMVPPATATDAPPAAASASAAPGAPERPPVTLLLGRAGAADALQPVKLDSFGAVYLIRPKAAHLLSADPLTYRSREVLAVAPDDVQEIRLLRAGAEQRIERDVGGVFVPAGRAAGVLAAGVPGRLLGALAALRAERLMAENPPDLAPYGLAEPTAILTVGLRVEAGIGRTLLFGRREPGGAFAMVRGQDVVFLLAPETADALLADLVEDGGRTK